MNWLKLTAPQAAQLASLSASNPGNNYLTPRADAQGALWLAADVLDAAAGTFVHYASLLAQLTPTAQTPTWPASAAL